MIFGKAPLRFHAAPALWRPGLRSSCHIMWRSAATSARTTAGTIPTNQRLHGGVQGSVGASYFFIPPQQGRGFNTNFQWYWGAQGGFFLSKTNTQPYVYDPIVGGHWLITSRRTALYLAYEQSFFLTDAQAVIFDPASSNSSVGPGFRDVTFKDVRRLMFGVLRLPGPRR